MANFNLLQSIQQPKIVGQLPSTAPSSDGGDDLGSLFQGIAGLAQSFDKKPQELQSSGSYGSNQMQNVLGTSQSGQSQLQAGINQTPKNGMGIFDSALQQVGLKEGNPVLNDYLMKANPHLDPTQTPWCAGFVGSVLNANGMKGTGSLAAKSYLNYGQPVQNPSKGDIVVFNDMTGNNDPAHGHVGFVQSVDPQTGMVSTLGGNQGNAVSIKNYPLSNVAGFRRPPTGQEVQQFAQQNNIQTPHQLSQITSEQAPNLQATMDGIAHVESGGAQNPYQVMSKPTGNDRAYGKYQVMGNNIPHWTQEALGQSMTPQEFLNNPQAQEQTARYKINQNLQKYGNPQDAFSVWFSGRPVNKAGNSSDVYGTTVPQYIQKASQGYLMSLQQAQKMRQPNQQAYPQQQVNPNVQPGTTNPIVQILRNLSQPSQQQAPIQPNSVTGTQASYQEPSQIQQSNQVPTDGSQINWGLLQALQQSNSQT